jgi:multiple sugar transport system substrate-binding protein
MQRHYLTALLCACLVLAAIKVFSNGSLTQHGRTRVNFWNGWTGPDGVAMLDVIRDFNRDNPDIEVSMQRMDWSTYYNKLMVSTLSHRGPEVFVIHASTLPRMVRAGFVADVANMFGPKYGIEPTDFEPKVLDSVRFGDKMVGVPLDVHMQGLYCDADLFKRAGLTNPDGSIRTPKNKDDFIDDIKATQKIDSNGDHDIWGFSWTMWRFNFMSLVPQFHGHYFDEKGNPDLACPGNVAALEFMGDLMNKQKLAPLPESNMGWTGYRQKKVAMVLEGVYMVGDLKTLEDFHPVGASVPQIGPQPGTLADSHCLCIRADLSGKEREASERFIAYLSQHSIEWARAGQVPARISVRNSDAFKALPIQYAFSKEIPFISYPPKTPLLFELTQELDLAVEKVLRGRATAKEALDVANQNLIVAANRDREENAQ